MLAMLHRLFGHPPSLQGERIVLVAPVQADYEAWAILRGESRDTLTPFEPAWSEDELSRPSFQRRLRRYRRERRLGCGAAFFIKRRSDRVLLGGLALTNIRGGVTQSGSIGYWLGRCHVGKGYATDAVRLAVGQAFDVWGLHRVEAACLPNNTPSIRVLERCGFQREGLARGYLRIDGAFRDHLLFARLADDPQVACGRRDTLTAEASLRAQSHDDRVHESAAGLRDGPVAGGGFA
jgi:ribosomal-protein-alanine N-acetyltransferase